MRRLATSHVDQSSHERTHPKRQTQRPPPVSIGSEWAKPDAAFWKLWRANKASMIEAGYSVRKTTDGWQARFRPRSRPLPERERSTGLTVPAGKKALICLECGNADLIDVADDHPACTACGDDPAFERGVFDPTPVL
jgi:hypothetical protein